MKRTTILLTITCLLAVALAAQEEGGGRSGADFLLSLPATRVDAMGGVVDGQGNPLESYVLNPATLMLDPSFRLVVGLAPLPNDVTNSQVSIGIPVADGMVAASAQLLSAGDFTFVNQSGQASGTVSLFDAAASVGYARYVWGHLAAGANGKVVYRSLGDDAAFAAGIDLGAAWWFETPHVGQRPKPPTMDELEARLARELRSTESEREKRTRQAAGDVASLRGDKEKLEQQLAGLREDRAAAAEDADTTRLDERLAATGQQLNAVIASLAAAERASASALAEIETWYKAAIAAAQAAHAARAADLRDVETERARLFAVVDDPQMFLSADDIDTNVDVAIDRTTGFLADRRAALIAALAEYSRSRSERRAEIEAQITRYEAQIAEVLGPESQQLAATIARLQRELADLEAAEGDNRAQIQTTRSALSDADKQRDQLERDPWVRRIRQRIADKQKVIAELVADLVARARENDERIARLENDTEREIARFEALRAELQTNLRRAALRRELDLIDARSERATQRALVKYKAEEQTIYQRLLAAMYRNEERIFNARLDTARSDSLNRTFAFESSLIDERDTAEDDFAFGERFLQRRIAALKREQPVNESRVAEAETELATLRARYNEQIAELARREQQFRQDERSRLDAEVAEIQNERRKVRLIYLQTDDPYRNTSVTLAVRNLGTNLTFVETGYPMPRTAALGLSYGVLNTDLHRATLSTELEMPLYGQPTLADLEIGLGAEYVFAGLAGVRAGYAFGSLERSFSVGFGLDFSLGFTNYAIDYAFRPLPDYGLQHTIGVSIGF